MLATVNIEDSFQEGMKTGRGKRICGTAAKITRKVRDASAKNAPGTNASTQLPPPFVHQRIDKGEKPANRTGQDAHPFLKKFDRPGASLSPRVVKGSKPTQPC
nr:unnamed protein product [Callosobruchus chinensis]